ncbi:hypothetical protein IC582_007714 [Cucumis melo]
MRRGWGKLDFINRIIVDESSNETCTDRLIRYIFHIDRSTFMFLLYEYDIFWVFLIISSLIPILAFLISEVLAPLSKEPEKLLSYESGIEPMGDACFDVLGVSVFIEALIFVLILIVGLVYAWRKGAMEWS